MFFVFLVLIVCSFWQLSLLLFFHDYLDFIFFVRMISYTINFIFLFNILGGILLSFCHFIFLFFYLFFPSKTICTTSSVKPRFSSISAHLHVERSTCKLSLFFFVFVSVLLCFCLCLFHYLARHHYSNYVKGENWWGLILR